MSNLVTHAERELRLIGYDVESAKIEGAWDPDRAMVTGLLSMVKIFANQGHSGSSAAYQSQVLGKLLTFDNLTPLTDDPAEWVEVGDGMYQNIRNSKNFSHDGGRSYWTLDEYKPLYGLYKKLPQSIRVWVIENKRNWVMPIHTSKISGKAAS